MMVGVPALRVGLLEPLHETGKGFLLALGGPEDQVEMVGHDDIREQPHVEAPEGLRQDFFKCRVVGIAARNAAKDAAGLRWCYEKRNAKQ